MDTRESRKLYPISPMPEDDARFTLGLLLDVANVLVKHGYPAVEQPGDHTALMQTLYRFLYVNPNSDTEA